MWYMYSIEYYSAIKRNEIMPFAATGMDPEILILSEVSQRRRHSLCWNLKRNDTNELTKQKETHRLGEQTYGCWGEGRGEGILREFGVDMYTLLCLKWRTNKDLLYIAQGTLLNVMWQPGWERGLGENVKVAQSCPTLWDPMDYTVHGILQARILEWVAFPFSRGSS